MAWRYKGFSPIHVLKNICVIYSLRPLQIVTMDIHIQEPSVEINFNFSGKISLISNYWVIW